jgi:hypothetical protein
MYGSELRSVTPDQIPSPTIAARGSASGRFAVAFHGGPAQALRPQLAHLNVLVKDSVGQRALVRRKRKDTFVNTSAASMAAEGGRRHARGPLRRSSRPVCGLTAVWKRSSAKRDHAVVARELSAEEEHGQHEGL